MARGSVIARKRKDGTTTWHIKYRLPDGTQKMEAIGDRKRVAEEALAERMRDINRGAYRPIEDVTFADLAEQWLKHHVETRYRPTSRDVYRGIVNNHLVPAFQHQRVSTITPASIDAAVASFMAKGLKTRTADQLLTVLRQILRFAVERDFLSVSPADRVRPLRFTRPEMRFWSVEQIEAFLEWVPDQHSLMYHLAIFTGARAAELWGLEWRDVDLPGAALSIRRARTFSHGTQPPKTRAGERQIDLLDRVVSKLEAKAALLGPRPEDRVLIGPRGGHLKPNYVHLRLLRERQLPDAVPRIRFHDLRHTYAALLIRAGAHPKFIQHQLGHSSITTTLDTYGHLMPNTGKHSVAQVEQLFRDPDQAGAADGQAQ